MAHTPTFRVTVVSRSMQAVNYKHRGGATKLDFAGTDLMPAGERPSQSRKQEGLHRNRSGIWQSAKAHDFRQ